jgi:CelD/BcsL family acetyltransferase involved in cellulose biosynthesis
MSRVIRIDPLSDARWQTFVEEHADASVFHTKAWLAALHRTYKYDAAAYAIEDGDRLTGGLPFCAITSFITGRRLVSLPFSDHCQPLVGAPEDLGRLVGAARTEALRERFKYVEIRPLISSGPEVAFATSDSVLVHMLDISPSEDQLLKTFHTDSIRRKISKGSRENLRYDEGQSEELLQKFYALLLMTRRRHGIPPQPMRWFRNLIDCFGTKLKISVASKDGAPIASVITLWFKKTVVYKYGCSDPEYNPLGGMIFLLWQTIRRAKNCGFAVLDLGRSDYSTPGLITFKDRWGSRRVEVNYYRSGASAARQTSSRLSAAAKRIIVRVPDPMFGALGGFLYRHVG